MFAAVSSDTLHLEASWSEQRRVRLFVSDASGSPLSLERLRTFTALAIAGNGESPFSLIEANAYFEARISTLPTPAVIVVLFKASATAPAERVTFSFSSYSAAVVPGSLSPAEIPGTLKGILEALAAEQRTTQSVIERAEFSELLGSEDRIRDLVLATEPYLDRLSTEARGRAQLAITGVVRACWLLHTVLDYGTVPQRDAAIKQLNDALDRTLAALSGLAE
jgi:hypothetical protein